MIEKDKEKTAMIIGIPKGLLYARYHVFSKTFFEALGAQTVVSPDTNKQILKEGTTLCVDEACLPVKVFHGHAAWLAPRCDRLFMPRLLSVQQRQLLCPMFCGLDEMIKNSIEKLPPLIEEPVTSFALPDLFKWALKAARAVCADRKAIKAAFDKAVSAHRAQEVLTAQRGYTHNVALIGHSYILFDRFVSMNLISKLNALGLGIVTAETVPFKCISRQVQTLFKQPFWFFARQFYGGAIHLYKKNRIDGIIYVSAFSCGVDSVVIELIRNAVCDFPMMILKIDEHTGEAGFDTRIEAFADMLGRRPPVDRHIPAHGEYLSGSQSVF